VQIGRKEGIQELTQAVSVARGGGQPGLKEGEHASLLQTRPHLIERLLAVQTRQE
jgi:hypothetical protein